MRALLALTVFGGGGAHATLAPALGIHGVTPDLPLIVVVLLALRQGPEFGCVAGFAAGLLQDATGGGLIGVQALTKAVIGFAMGAAGSRLAVTQPLVQVPGLVILTVAEGLARFALLKVFHFPATFGDVMLYVVLPQALYNGFLGAALVVALTCVESLRARAALASPREPRLRPPPHARAPRRRAAAHPGDDGRGHVCVCRHQR